MQQNYLEGSLWDKILLFALPLAASSFLQQLFNAADSAVVGQFAGNQALAAVGSVASFINLLINLFVGLSIGANVVIAQYIGEGKRERIHRAVHTSITLSVSSGILLLILGQLLTNQVLTFMQTPQDTLALARIYLRIYFLGMPFMMLYNFCASILRSIGDTRRPVICLAIAGVVNVCLNLLLVIVFHLDVAGVAIATVTSNIISSLLMLYLLCHERSAVRVDLSELCIDKDILIYITKIGLPAGLQGMVFSFSNVIIQTSINSLGSDVMAASTTSLNFEYFAYFLANSFNQAATTFVGQNYGAANLKRCRQVTRWCLLLGMTCTGLFTGLLLLCARPLAGIFTGSAIVLSYAVLRMRYILSFEIVNEIMEVLSGTMRGYGRSFVPALLCIIGVCVFRLIYVATIFRLHPTFNVLMSVYPCSWILTSAAMIIAYLILCRILSGSGSLRHSER